jgi:hypothetical protein
MSIYQRKLVTVSGLHRYARKLDADKESRSVFRFIARAKATWSDIRASAKALIVVRGFSRHGLRGL